MPYLYRHIRLDTNIPFYIGIGSDNKNLYKRAFTKHSRNKFWNNIISKSKYEVEILLDNLTWEEACIKEKEFIKLYGRRDLNKGPLVNLTDGGEGSLNCVKSNETKLKMHLYKLGHETSDLTKIKLSLNHVGFKDKNHSEESINNIRKYQLGRKKSTVTKNKIGLAKLGTIYINNSLKNKRVPKSEIAFYIDNGWNLGMKKRVS